MLADQGIGQFHYFFLYVYFSIVGRRLVYLCRVVRSQELWKQVEQDNQGGVQCVLHHSLDGTILFVDARYEIFLIYFLTFCLF